MDNNHHSPTGLLGIVTTIFGAVITWISLPQAQILMTICASGVTILVGLLTARYYHNANKKLKQK